MIFEYKLLMMNRFRAPPGCLQYFYGKARHTVESFGWDGTKTYSTGGSLAKMFYTTCFRPEKGGYLASKMIKRFIQQILNCLI